MCWSSSLEWAAEVCKSVRVCVCVCGRAGVCVRQDGICKLLRKSIESAIQLYG